MSVSSVNQQQISPPSSTAVPQQLQSATHLPRPHAPIIYSIGDRVWKRRSPGAQYPGMVVTIIGIEHTELGTLYRFEETLGKWGGIYLSPLDEQTELLARLRDDATAMRALASHLMELASRTHHAIDNVCYSGTATPKPAVAINEVVDELRRIHSGSEETKVSSPAAISDAPDMHTYDAVIAFPCMTFTSLQTPAEILEEERSETTRVRYDDVTGATSMGNTAKEEAV